MVLSTGLAVKTCLDHKDDMKQIYFLLIDIIIAIASTIIGSLILSSTIGCGSLNPNLIGGLLIGLGIFQFVFSLLGKCCSNLCSSYPFDDE